ncbi:hypothetical protein [Aureispira sp. CCB-QB1]|uniref:hypothetical protein n=1 Tax=Aureispira sp. CCB-QB1 TaxID=1313421 RepID=UPI0006981E3C|nr:hypothetical protein [Aureispira sp. CCB-QB1]
MKKAFILITVLLLSFSTPSNSFFKVEHTNIIATTKSQNPIQKRAKKQKRKGKKKQQIKFKTTFKKPKITQDRKSWASLPLMIVAFVFFLAALGLFLFAPLAIFFVVLLGVAVLCFLVFLIVSLAINSWGQERGGKNSPKETTEKKPLPQRIREKNNDQTPKMPDVVYLKNGSIIKCTIIEQIIGETIKIETSDGSIFVYKMEEVSKITKAK